MTLTDDDRRLLAASVEALHNLAEGLQIIINNMEERTATAAQVDHLLLTAGGFPQNEPSALQDVFDTELSYCKGLSGSGLR